MGSDDTQGSYDGFEPIFTEIEHILTLIGTYRHLKSNIS